MHLTGAPDPRLRSDAKVGSDPGRNWAVIQKRNLDRIDAKFGYEVRLLGWPGLGASARLSVAHCFINEWWRRWLFGWLNGWPRPRLQRQLDCFAGDVVDVDVDVEDSGSGVPREGTRASK
jgi:hypothetical protein